MSESRRKMATTSPALRSPLTLLLPVLVVISASGCTRDQWQRFPSPDDVVATVPWFSTMHRGLAVQPYAAPMREPVAGTVPITGGMLPLHVENDADLPAINRLSNPAANTSESLNRGKELWGIYCLPCHGVEGRGDVPIAPKFMRPPDFTAPHPTPMSEGYVYTMIRYGRGIMPPYGDKVRGLDRWHLVNYVMLLRGMHQVGARQRGGAP